MGGQQRHGPAGGFASSCDVLLVDCPTDVCFAKAAEVFTNSSGVQCISERPISGSLSSPRDYELSADLCAAMRSKFGAASLFTRAVV